MNRKSTLVAVLATILFAVLLIGSSSTQATEKPTSAVLAKHQDQVSFGRVVLQGLAQGAHWLHTRFDRITFLDDTREPDQGGKRLPLSEEDKYEIKSILPGPWVYPPPDTGK
ncbi:hypothetical protein JW992_06630 [candidate division KSB1 bacterium]|nr:hypothetical protein [candidate division KSB1 bacterium]